MKNFEDNDRRKQEIKGRPFADEIYRQVFGENVYIMRHEKPDNFELDRTFAMDLRIISEIGLILVGQEKFLSNKYETFKTLTIEYMQNPIRAEKGDWFKMAVQIYFTGYFNKVGNGFGMWVIADWAQIVIETLKGNVDWKIQENKFSCAEANF
jgi:hypothetical protein